MRIVNAGAASYSDEGFIHSVVLDLVLVIEPFEIAIESEHEYE